MSSREIDFQAELILGELINLQRDFEIEDENMLPILHRIIEIVQHCPEPTDAQTFIHPVNGSLEH